MNHERLCMFMSLVLLGAADVKAADLSVDNLTLAPGAMGTVTVSGNIDGESTAGVNILVELSPQGGNTGTVVFTSAPPTDVVQLGDPWPGAGTFSAFDTDLTGTPNANGSVDDNGTLVPAPVSFTPSMALSGFPVVASGDASGVWDVTLSTSFGNSNWEGLPTTLIDGTITIMGANCPGPGDGDVNGDTFIDGLDVVFFVDQMISPAGPPDPFFCASDIDGDNDVDDVDLPQFVELVLDRPFGACCQGDGNCSQEVPSNCTGEGFVFNGIGIDCGAVSCPVRPVNDTCASATPTAAEGTIAYDTTNADSNDPSIIDADVYYCWTAPCDGAVRVETCGLTSVDSKILVYDNCACPPQLPDLVTSLNTTCGQQSRLDFTATMGISYLIRVGSKPGSPGGPGSFSITCDGLPGADACASAQPIAGDGIYYFDNRTATTDGPPEANPICAKAGQPQIENDVWFCWTADCNADVTAETCGTLLDTKLAVYDGCTCPPAAAALDCDDDALLDCGLQSRVTWTAIGGNSYLIRVGSFDAMQSGIGPLTISSSPACP